MVADERATVAALDAARAVFAAQVASHQAAQAPACLASPDRPARLLRQRVV
jgi:hypothetical protein